MANIMRRNVDVPVSSLRREIDQLFDDFFTNPLGMSSSLARVPEFNPSLELTEADDKYVLSAELPGIDQEGVEVQIDDNLLTIRGEKKREEKKSGKGYEYSERSYGAFARSVRLPVGTDPDQVVASFANGVLEVTIPKGQGARARSIPIKKDEAKAGVKKEVKTEKQP